MKRKIPCPCDNVFSVEAPDEINLDETEGYIDEILDGSFMNYTCPSCGKKHKPEFPLFISWPSRKTRIEVIPERERGEFYRRKEGPKKTETVIGYPEMAERVTIIRDGLEAAAVEALKYHLMLKAQESCPDGEIGIWYQNKGPAGLEFHIHGLRPGEIAVTQIPASLYERVREDYAKHPRNELFSSLRFRSYLSVQNTMRPEEMK